MIILLELSALLLLHSTLLSQLINLHALSVVFIILLFILFESLTIGVNVVEFNVNDFKGLPSSDRTLFFFVVAPVVATAFEFVGVERLLFISNLGRRLTYIKM